MSKFPSFDDFESTLTMEQILQWVDSANEAELNFSLPLTVFNIKDFNNALISASVLVNREMLHAYHEWLAEQLERTSLRIVRD